MPFTFMPQQFWGGLTGVDQALQPVIEALNHRNSLQGRMERQIAQDPHTWYNSNLGQLGAGAGRRMQRLFGDDIYVDPLNYNDYAIRGYGQPVKPGMVKREDAQEARGQEYLRQTAQGQDDYMQRLIAILGNIGQPQQEEYPSVFNQPPRYEQGGPVKEPTKSQLEQFLELLGIEREGIPIVAHPGEFVLNREATQSIGKDKLEQLNQNARNAPRMQGGGDALVEYYISQGISREQAESMARERTGAAARARSAREGQRISPSTGTRTPPREPGPAPEVGREPDQIMEMMLLHEAGPEARQQLQRMYADQGLTAIPEFDERYYGTNLAFERKPQTEGTVQVPYFMEEQLRYATPERQKRRLDELKNTNTLPTQPVNAPTPKDERVRPREEERVREEEDDANVPVPPPPRQRINLPMPPQRQAPIYGRAHNQAPDIPWEEIGRMDPYQAAAVLQQYANTQSMGPASGLHAALQSSGPPQQEFMNQLMQQYGQIAGVAGTQAQTQGQQIQNRVQGATAEDQIEATKLQVKELAARSPYFEDLAKLEVTQASMNALAAYAQAEAAAQDKSIKFMQMNPADMLKLVQSGINVNQDLVKDHEDAARSAYQVYEVAKEEGSKDQAESAYKSYLKKQLLVELLRAPDLTQITYDTMPLPQEEARNGLLGGLFGEVKSAGVSEEEFNRVYADAMSLRERMNYTDQIMQQFAGLPNPGAANPQDTMGLINRMMQSYEQTMQGNR